MKRLMLQCGALALGFAAFLLLGSLIEALAPCPMGTILVLLGCLFGGGRLLEAEEQEAQKNAARRGGEE